MRNASTPHPVNVLKIVQAVQIDAGVAAGSSSSFTAELTSLDGTLTYSSLPVSIIAGAPVAQPTPPEANITLTLGMYIDVHRIQFSWA